MSSNLNKRSLFAIDTSIPSGLPPIGSAGGDLSGIYPNPSVVWANGYSTYDTRYQLLTTPEVTSFNTRTGAITLTSGDVTGALGYTPYNATNPSGYITSSFLTDTLINGKLLTGYVSGAGTISATDSILQGIQKLNGNISALVTGVSSVNSLTGAVALTGTANRITISASNVFDISASYVGQSSITTLGTISTGTWSATTIAANKGGTGTSSYTIGDILYADSTSTLAKLADVAAGSYLRSGGTATAPVWSTLTLPNSATATQVVYATGTNAWGSGSLMTYTASTGQFQVTNSVSGVAAIAAFGSSGGAAWPYDGTVYAGGTNGVLRGTISSDANNTALNALVFQRQQTSSPTQVLAGSGIISKQTFNYTGVGNATNVEMTRVTDYWYNVASKHAKHSLWATYNGTPVEYVTITGAGVYVGGNTTPTAVLHLAAGTATASTAPIKLTSGTNLTSTEVGALEFTNPFLYFTPTATSGDRRLVQLGTRNAQSGTTYTAATTDVNCVIGLTNTAARTITLPAANTIPAGNPIWFKDEAGTASSANITINRAGSDTIDGATSATITTNYGMKGLYSNGSNAWFIM